MFREIKNVKQERGAGRRRWFESDGLELVVWLDQAEAIIGFQLCYDFGRGEYALTWRAGVGFAHSEVDPGESTPFKNETPVLVPNGHAPWRQIVDAFAARDGMLEPGLRDFVQERLRAEAIAERR